MLCNNYCSYNRRNFQHFETSIADEFRPKVHIRRFVLLNIYIYIIFLIGAVDCCGLVEFQIKFGILIKQKAKKKYFYRCGKILKALYSKKKNIIKKNIFGALCENLKTFVPKVARCVCCFFQNQLIFTISCSYHRAQAAPVGSLVASFAVRSSMRSKK